MAEVRWQRSDGRGQKAEDGRQRTEGREKKVRGWEGEKVR
jgi:hypothetical protein